MKTQSIMVRFAFLFSMMLNLSMVLCFRTHSKLVYYSLLSLPQMFTDCMNLNNFSLAGMNQKVVLSARQFASGKLLERLTMGLVPRRHKKFFSKPTDSLIDLAKTTNHKILKFPHPKLRQENLPVTKFDESLRILAGEMLLLMYTTDGVGLAAPQIGVNLQLMVFNEDGTIDKREKEEIICNPKIVNKSAQRIFGTEGCLSFPQIYGEVERHSWIEVEFQNLVGESKVKKFEGFPAIVFQHEFDHLNKVSKIFCWWDTYYTYYIGAAYRSLVFI